MRKIEEQFEECMHKAYESNKTSAFTVKEYLERVTADFPGGSVKTLQIPKIYTRKEVQYFESIVNKTYHIFEKIIKAYLENPEYRKIYPFRKDIEELILIPNLYQSVLPIARFDIFLNEEDYSFKFCEINTDGTSAMNEDRLLNVAIEENLAFQTMKESHAFRSFELFDTWVKEFIEIYRTYEKRVEHPYIAIADFMEAGTTVEFTEFQSRFEKAGFTAEVCEIRKLRYEGGVLYSPTGNKIDAIYRRAVTCDIENKISEIPDFITAIKEQAVCVIGSLCTQIIHNKWLFKVIKEEMTLNLLTKEEQEFVLEHIPTTWILDEEMCDMKQILEEKEKWIIKPLDSYAAKGVFAGSDYTEEEWACILQEKMGKQYIVQEYCILYKTNNIDLTEENPKMLKYSNMTGLYVYNGTFSGVYARLSDGGIISSEYNEKAVATLVVDEK